MIKEIYNTQRNWSIYCGISKAVPCAVQ